MEHSGNTIGLLGKGNLSARQMCDSAFCSFCIFPAECAGDNTGGWRKIAKIASAQARLLSPSAASIGERTAAVQLNGCYWREHERLSPDCDCYEVMVNFEDGDRKTEQIFHITSIVQNIRSVKIVVVAPVQQLAANHAPGSDGDGKVLRETDSLQARDEYQGRRSVHPTGSSCWHR